ncbi:hypothetical protein [Enterococcus faecalis]|nr:hypothetical protein [Enterococcus faecalis]MEB7792199.1 hypothetical protein [Enterococcus faecalis]MEB7810219.1 hypothetical protein [Enterococcus faecalis]
MVGKIIQGISQIKDELIQQLLAKDIKKSDLINNCSTIKMIQTNEGVGIV